MTLNNFEQSQEKIHLLEQDIEFKEERIKDLTQLIDIVHELNTLGPEDNIFGFVKDAIDTLFKTDEILIFKVFKNEKLIGKKIYSAIKEDFPESKIQLCSFYKKVINGKVTVCYDTDSIPTWNKAPIKTNYSLSIHFCVEGKNNHFLLVIFMHPLNFKPSILQNLKKYRPFANQFIEKLENAHTIKKQIKTIAKNRDDLLRRENIKETFFANVSHEIRTPLNIILGIIQSLEDRQVDNYLRNMILLMRGSAENLLFLINDILDLSKIQNNSFTIFPTPNSLSEFMFEVSESFAYRKTKNLKLEVTLDQRIPEDLIFDSIRLKQVFNNIISNAFKFTKRGYVNAYIYPLKIEKDQVLIKTIILDTGRGISIEKLKDIFDPYTQDALEHQYSGTGLGLTITQKIIELMNGKIKIESKVGVGTKVSFDMAIKRDPAQHKATKKKVSQQNLNQVSDNLKVLIVDDNHINIYVFKELLSEKTIQTMEAYSGREALEKAKKIVFDIIFMDINMPHISGIETAAEIKKDSLNKNTPIIAFTAHATKSEVAELTSSFFDDILTKPVLKDKLYEVLSKLSKNSEEYYSESTQEYIFNDSLYLNAASGLMRCQSNRGLYVKLLTIFLEDNDDFIEKIQSIYTEKDIQDLQKLEFITHKISGSAGNLGLDKLYDIVKALNIQVHSGTFNFDEALYDSHKIIDAFEETKNYIEQYIQQGSDLSSKNNQMY